MSDAEISFEDWVRERAYALWEAAGRPEHRADVYWQQAWDELSAGERKDEPNASRPDAAE